MNFMGNALHKNNPQSLLDVSYYRFFENKLKKRSSSIKRKKIHEKSPKTLYFRSNRSLCSFIFIKRYFAIKSQTASSMLVNIYFPQILYAFVEN